MGKKASFYFGQLLIDQTDVEALYQWIILIYYDVENSVLECANR